MDRLFLFVSIITYVSVFVEHSIIIVTISNRRIKMKDKMSGVIKEMYYDDLWKRLCRNSTSEVLSPAAIERISKRSYKEGIIFNIFKESTVVSKKYLENLIKENSRCQYDELYCKGVRLTEPYFDSLFHNMNLKEIKSDNKVTYAMVVKRSDIRTFPTEDRVFKTPHEYAIDRFMESSVYIGEPCIIYLMSSDKKWYFCRTYNYCGWIKKDNLAIGDKDVIEAYFKSEKFIMVTGGRLLLGVNPINNELSNIVLDMGTRLALAQDLNEKDIVDDMYCGGNYVVKYPLSKDGRLYFKRLLIPYSMDVHQGYLKCTRANIISQIFKFQGERYGWGGDFQGRDCASLMVDTFKTMGLYLPRNTGQQCQAAIGTTVHFSTENASEKLEIIKGARPGTLLYLKGHVVMKVGDYNGDTYIIHDTIGTNIKNESGEMTYIPANGVIVSLLKDIFTSGGNSYIKEIVAMKDLVGK